MVIHINKYGFLVITTETETEQFALRQALGIIGDKPAAIEVKQSGRMRQDWERGRDEITIGKVIVS